MLLGLAVAQEADKGKKSRTPVRQAKLAGANGPVESVLNINSLETWVATDGFFDAKVGGGWNGSFPRGTQIGLIFREGIVWGARVNDNGASGLRIRAGGSSQSNGLNGGRAVGYVADPYSPPTGFEDPSARQVWRVRTDWETADLAIDAASFNRIEPDSSTDEEIAEVKAQYSHDWDHWPATSGAPYEDVDGNGSYDPAIDIPGFPGASQTIWFVANDLDADVNAILAGSPPIGLEMQMTLWAYDFPITLPLGSTIFKRVRLIYTGQIGGSPTATIDTMYVTQWSDPDLGDFGDDFVGWDSALQMGYVYNGRSEDAVYADHGLAPPAAGYALLQGPVKGADTLVSNSFTFFGGGDGGIGEGFGVYTATLHWFNLMEGFLHRPEYPVQELRINPITGEETKFWLDGDPLTGTGWIDGIVQPPGDRIMLQTTGPFQMALGDTQDIVIAFIAGIGNTRFESIEKIRKGASIAHLFYNEGFPPIPDPGVTVIQPNSSEAELTITLDLSISAEEVIAEVYNYNDVLENTLSLSDDGNNGDGEAGDSTWGVKWLTNQRPYGMYINALIISGADTVKWLHIVDNVTTLGPIELDDLIILNDNINNDGAINSGEKFSFDPVINNGSDLGIGAALVSTFSSDDNIILRSLIDATTIDSLPPGNTIMQDNPEQYFVLSDVTPNGHLLNFSILIVDNFHNKWVTEFQKTVTELSFNADIRIAEHTEGSAQGIVGYRVADPSALTNESYEITINEVNSEFSFNLENLSTSTLLLDSIPFPDDKFSSAIPIIEGFKLVFEDMIFKKPKTIESTEFTVDADPSDGDLSMWGDGTLFGNPDGFYTTFGSGTPVPTIDQAQPDLEWRFTGVAADNGSPVTEGGQYSTQWSIDAFGAPSLTGFQNVQLRLPFELWNVDGTDTSLHHQIEVAVMNRNTNRFGPTYGIWRMSGRDYMVILNKEYTDDAAPIRSLNDPTATWLLFFQQGGGSVWSTGDEFIVRFANPLQAGVDEYRFQVPTELEAIGIPETFELSQNFPNPFNAETTIQYSLPSQSDVKLLIYNLLSQEVFRFEVRDQKLGKYQIKWNGKNKRGNELSSGLYIYRFFAGNSVQTKKMILLK